MYNLDYFHNNDALKQNKVCSDNWIRYYDGKMNLFVSALIANLKHFLWKLFFVWKAREQTKYVTN